MGKNSGKTHSSAVIKSKDITKIAIYQKLEATTGQQLVKRETLANNSKVK